jgi:hypothetical protein
MINCPRCGAAEPHCRIQHEGIEDDRTVWRVYGCAKCAFNWRDNEPATTINPTLRDAFFQMDPSRPDDYPHNIPPPKVRPQ